VTTTHRSPAAPRVRWLALAVVATAIAVYFPGQYLLDGLSGAAQQNIRLARTYAYDIWPIQAAFYAHITFAGLALLIGPLQFSGWLRARARNAHRWTGRTYVTSVAIGGLAAFVMSFVSSAGLTGFFGFGTLAILWEWATYRGYRAIRTGDLRSHQAWMIRSFALTYAAVTLRLELGLGIAGLLIFGPHLTFAQAYDYAYAPVPFLCFLPNLVIAELIIRRRGLPGLRMVDGQAARHPVVEAPAQPQRPATAEPVPARPVSNG
jgi:Predicted membrane protein (DUF2306)